MDAYRILVTGSRGWEWFEPIREALVIAQGSRPRSAMTLIHGMCNPQDPETRQPVPWWMAKDLPTSRWAQLAGADWLADVAAVRMRWSVKRVPAEWWRLGKRAGFVRNEKMVSLGADLTLAFVMPCTDPRCRRKQPHGTHGTSHCVGVAEKAGIPVQCITLPF